MNRTLFALALAVAALPSAAQAQIDFTNWHTPAGINAELANLAAAHPTRAMVFSIGNSVNGLPINCLKISDNVNVNETNEGDVVFVGLHHAREWISPETALFLAEQLLNAAASGSDPELTACVNNLEIWIIPALNPDGYQFTTTTGNRFWRKNRRNNGDGTFGVDLNRNYSYQWGGGSGAEGSDFTADDTYRGPFPFSEPETAALRDFVNGLHHPRGIVSYHSFSELFLRPWSYTTIDPPGERTLRYIAQDSIARMAAVHSHTYSETIWYNAYGETTDFFWGEKRIAGFTPELRPASGGLEGFNPPTTQILPNCQENLPAAIALIKDAGLRKVWIKDHASDTGVEPSAEWLGDHWSHAFWVSPDIWTEPEELVEGSTVTLNVRVHNDTAGTMSGCTVAAYYTDPRVALEFPGLPSVLIGEQTLDLPAGDTVVSVPWTVPTGTNAWGERHWCVGAIVYHPDDRPLTTQVERTSNIACRNFQTVEAVLGGQLLLVGLHNFLDVAAEYRVTVDRATLPRDWQVIVPMPPPPAKINRKALLLGIKQPVLEAHKGCAQPIRLIVPPTAKPGTVVDLQVHSALIPLVPGKREPVGNGYTFRVRVPDRARE
jgi:carboxypeptidase T